MTASEIRRTVEVEATPEEVWELLVDDDERASWFGGETTLDPTPGGDAVFTDPDGTTRHGRVEEVRPGERLAWTWWTDDDDGASSRVEIDLQPTTRGTGVSVVERPVLSATASVAAGPSVPLLDLELRLLCRASAPVVCVAG